MKQLKMIDECYRTMPWDLIDNVVFDVGNVLLVFNPDNLLRSIIPEAPEKYAALKQAVFASPYWAYLDMGVASIPEAAELMISTAPELADEIRRIMSAWSHNRIPITEGVETWNRCRRHGKKTVILSNYGDDAFANAEKDHPFLNEFDGKVISSRVHLIKPDPAIYQYTARTYSLVPERTLFIDDSPFNIAAAIHAGWQGLLYNEPGKLSRFFAE